MIVIGSHLSITKGYYHAVNDAVSIGANTFQFFTRNPRGGRAKKLDFDDLKKCGEALAQNKFGPILAHAPYTLNMCSNAEKTRDFAKMVFKDDLDRLQSTPCNMYNFHPGSHVGQGVEKGIELITDTLNQVITDDHNTTILLEIMSGKGTEVGSNFHEIKQIIDGVELDDKIGVCLDTCHVYAAGYDVVNDLDGVLDQFDKVIGLDRLKAIHLNDSKYPLGSKKDRHEVLGMGYIGLEGISKIVNNPRLKDLPFFLETPNDLQGYAREIQIVKGLTDNN